MLDTVKYTGNRSAVEYTVSLGELVVDVDWNETKTVSTGSTASSDGAIFNLVRGVSEAVGVWFNLTGKMKCFDHVELARQLSEVNEAFSENASTNLQPEAAVAARADEQPRVCGASYGHHSKTGVHSKSGCVRPNITITLCVLPTVQSLGVA